LGRIILPKRFWLVAQHPTENPLRQLLAICTVSVYQPRNQRKGPAPPPPGGWRELKKAEASKAQTAAKKAAPAAKKAKRKLSPARNAALVANLAKARAAKAANKAVVA